MKHVIFITLFLFCCLQANGQDDYLKSADECFEKGDYECAKKNYTLFQTWDGRDMSAQIQKAEECMRAMILADEYFKDEEYRKAKERYQIVLAKNPKDPHAKKQYELCEEQLKLKNDTVVDDTGNLIETVDEKKEEPERNVNEENQPVTIAADEHGFYDKLPVQSKKKPDNLHINSVKNNRSGLLFAAGGVSIAAGVAATLLFTRPYTEEKKDGWIEHGKEYILVYAAAGVIVGGVCIGSGISLKKKARLQPQNMDYSSDRSHSPAYRDKHLHLNLVAYGNEAGLRLTF